MSVPSRASDHRAGSWRTVLFVVAVGSLGPLWWISGARWGGGAGREELARARLALGAARHEEAWVRAERVLAANESPLPTDAEARTLAAEAALLAAQARLAGAAAQRDPEPSRAEFAAWRARQAAVLGAEARDCALVRLEAARLLRRRGDIVEAAGILEQMAADGTADGVSERERAMALAALGPVDAPRGLALARDLLASASTDAEIARNGATLGRVLELTGAHPEAAQVFSAAAEAAAAARLAVVEAEARLGRARALLASDRAGEALQDLRALLSRGPTRAVRVEAGILLAEADAAADESSLQGDLAEFRRVPAEPEELFAARARIAARRLRAGRLSDAAATWAAAFDHLGSRTFPAHLASSADALADLTRLVRRAPGAEDLQSLAAAAEGLAVALPSSEEAHELAAEVAERRARLAAERRDSARKAGEPSGAAELEARALFGRAAEFRLAAADHHEVVKSRSVANRMDGARDLFLGGWYEAALPVARRLVDEISSGDDRSAEARWIAARTLQELGRHGEAVDALARFLSLHRNAPARAHDAFVELARSLEKIGDFGRAENTLSEFLFAYDNVTPDAPQWRLALFRLGDLQARLAADLRARGDEEGAVAKGAQAARNLADATRRFPWDAENRFGAEVRLGMLAMARRDWDRAAGSLRAALALPGRTARLADPEAGAAVRRASLLLGECLWQRGDTAEAMDAFVQAWTTSSTVETVLALARIADCHERLGDARQAERFRDRAKAALAQVSAGNGGGRAREAAERLLERLVAGR